MWYSLCVKETANGGLLLTLSFLCSEGLPQSSQLLACHVATGNHVTANIPRCPGYQLWPDSFKGAWTEGKSATLFRFACHMCVHFLPSSHRLQMLLRELWLVIWPGPLPQKSQALVAQEAEFDSVLTILEHNTISSGDNLEHIRVSPGFPGVVFQGLRDGDNLIISFTHRSFPGTWLQRVSDVQTHRQTRQCHREEHSLMKRVLHLDPQFKVLH